MQAVGNALWKPVGSETQSQLGERSGEVVMLRKHMAFVHGSGFRIIMDSQPVGWLTNDSDRWHEGRGGFPTG
jgi:hypothetical protein